ncbi:threonine synthase [Methanosarcinales archaeon]|nr:MAG: threonine synthase [Methanosarcinales archaeon]
MFYGLRCIACGRSIEPDRIVYTCPHCGGLLEVVYDLDKIEISRESLEGVKESVWKYRSLLPFPADIKPISIQEGGTALYRCDRLAASIGIDELYVKHEGLNPTGSFKDRGMTVGVTKALELGMEVVACASTGNTSAALSIYAAKAGIPAVVLLPAGKVALGKVAQALMHGAKVIGIRGNFDDALTLVRDLCEKERFYLLNSINPYRLEGQKTIGFEIADQLGWRVPDRLVLPVGNAGNITAIFKGFMEFRAAGITDTVPKMCGIQAEGSCPVADAFRAGKKDIEPEKNPETIATAIRIGDPVNAVKALAAIYDSGVLADTVSDDEIIQAQRDRAKLEGIGVEPARGAAVAGLRKLVENGAIKRDESVVCVTTGHLLKDPEEVISVCGAPFEVDARIEEVMRVVRER